VTTRGCIRLVENAEADIAGNEVPQGVELGLEGLEKL
jgi:hypothetical protein